MQPGTEWTAQHVELAMALAITWDEYADAKQASEMVWEAAGSALPRRITVVVLAAALCESVVNLYLSDKLEAAKFQTEEWRKPVDKWRGAIGALVPGYDLTDTDGADLCFLFRCRDSIMHPKPRMTDQQGGVRHKGTADVWDSIDEGAIARIWDLPLRLLRNLEKWERFPAAYIHSGIGPFLTDIRLRKGLAAQNGLEGQAEP